MESEIFTCEECLENFIFIKDLNVSIKRLIFFATNQNEWISKIVLLENNDPKSLPNTNQQIEVQEEHDPQRSIGLTQNITPETDTINFEEIRTHALPEHDQSKAKRKYVKKTPEQKAIEAQRLKRPYKKRSTQQQAQTTDSEAGTIVLTE